ncbi:SE-domain-containing protein [Lentinus tigrinus ALCF2SS1-6]|uniref:Squalene monooxygenase n=2 Tax=Lentinus tigrinus TaxID=5365 RepID=A0A5C2S3V4_9APHY|nr:SE-domain-containing protein [Lentinus tigrinus ALCF2SS1-6]
MSAARPRTPSFLLPRSWSLASHSRQAFSAYAHVRTRTSSRAETNEGVVFRSQGVRPSRRASSSVGGIAAVPTYGYCVMFGGNSALRAKAKEAKCVEVVEATVWELIECPLSGRGGAVEREAFFADLIVVADGCFSNFRSQVMGKAAIQPMLKNHFVALLSYQLGTHDTRVLVDVKNPVPSELKNDRLRRMPNSLLPSSEQGKQTKEGVLLLGDSWNIRHPLTGGDMTVAFNHVVLLRDMLLDVKNLADWSEIKPVLYRWHWARKPLSSTVNILSVALYDLFGAHDPLLEVLRTGCFKYFELSGNCVREPVTLLAAIEQAPFTLFRHFFTIAFYSIWVLFTHPRQVGVVDGKPVLRRPRPDEYPCLAFKSLQVFWMARVVFMPLLWTELRP